MAQATIRQTIGSGFYSGGNTGAGGGSGPVSVTLSNAVATLAGSAIYVLGMNIAGVSDTAGNAYSLEEGDTNNPEVWVARNAAAIAAAGHITVTGYSGSFAAVVAVEVQGTALAPTAPIDTDEIERAFFGDATHPSSYPTSVALTATQARRAPNEYVLVLLFEYINRLSVASVITGTPSGLDFAATAKGNHVAGANNATVTLRVWQGTPSALDALTATFTSDQPDVELFYVTAVAFLCENVAPLAPTLTHRAGFDAAAAAPFAWAFNDAGDSQTAYQLVITRTSDGATAYDSGKVASGVSSAVLPAATLTNNLAYQWQVRTWDSIDLGSPFSALDSFSTAAAPVVSLSAPLDGDELPGNSLVVRWGYASAAGLNASAYRVRLLQGASVVSDTGTVLDGLARALTLTGLANHTAYTVEVTAWDSNDTASRPVTAALTTRFVAPEPPLVTIGPSADGGALQLSITAQT